MESAIRTTDGTTIDGITIGDRTSDAIVSTTGVAPSRPIGGARTIAVPREVNAGTAREVEGTAGHNHDGGTAAGRQGVTVRAERGGSTSEGRAASARNPDRGRFDL